MAAPETTAAPQAGGTTAQETIDQAGEAMVEFHNVSKIYPGQAAVENLTLSVATGKITVFVGPSVKCSLKMTLKILQTGT